MGQGRSAKDRLNLIRFLATRDGYVCATEGCPVEYDLTIDHRIARGLGGSNLQENLQLMCSKHNSEKSLGESKACEAWRGQDTKSAARLEYERKLLWTMGLTSVAS